MKAWTHEEEEEFERLWRASPGKLAHIARRLGRTRNSLVGKAFRLNLHRDRSRRNSSPSPAALSLGVSMHRVQLRNVERKIDVLKSGRDAIKIGYMIQKGRWQGMPIYTLTLEERATCPRSCRHWEDCYGNNMGLARRWRHGRPLEDKLEQELRILARRHPAGYVVRLHMLGDFYSEDYVLAWYYWLNVIPQLHVFGYTAHSPRENGVGSLLTKMSDSMWERFAMRFSNSGLLGRATSTNYDVPEPKGLTPQGVVCPAQTGQTRACVTCGLCWQSPDVNIVFLPH